MEKYDNGGFYELTMEFNDQQLFTALHELHTNAFIPTITFDGDYIEIAATIAGFSCIVTALHTASDTDWLTISVSQKILRREGYEIINDTFVKFAENLYAKAPFMLALIGEEVQGITTYEELRLEELSDVLVILPKALQKKLQLNKLQRKSGLVLIKTENVSE